MSKRRKKIKRSGKAVNPFSAPIPVEESIAESSPQDNNPSPKATEKPIEDGSQEEQGNNADSQEDVAAPSEPDISGDIWFPLTSSHLLNGKVRTSAICITPHGCGILHCNAMPKTPNIGADKIAGVHRAILQKMGFREKQRKLAEQLVLRAREGDQNAMAIMALTRKNAENGNPRATSALNFMKQFIARTPVKNNPLFGAECASSVLPDNYASVMFANGPPLSNSRIMRTITSFGSEHEARTFVRGIKNWNANEGDYQRISIQLDKLSRDILKLGRTIGQARAIQMVRMPHTPISVYDVKAGWEMGE